MIEIVPIKELNSEITVPGSKYVANRVLIAAGLAERTSIIKNIPENDDINVAMGALKQFGVGINKENNILEIRGTDGEIKNPTEEINVHDSGTLMRFIISFAALSQGEVKITGSKRIQQRPVGDLLKSLSDLGVNCKSLNKNCPPIVVEGGTFKGGITKIKGDVSSQFISSLLLISPYAEKDVEILIETDLVSKNYVDMTICIMKQFGVSVERHGYEKFIVKAGQKYSGKEFLIPADWSSANYFLAAAAIVPGTVKINNLDMESEQESGFADILAKMGCDIEKNISSIKVTGNSNLSGVEVDMSDMPDSVQTLAVVSCFAKGITRIKNIAHLRYKESDRINDTVKELQKLGIKAESKDNELIIEGGDLTAAVIDSHNDHRMAMSFALVGLKVSGIKIKNPECVNKSFPQFWDKLKEIDVEIKNV